jgi:hypothetical protein
MHLLERKEGPLEERPFFMDAGAAQAASRPA